MSNTRTLRPTPIGVILVALIMVAVATAAGTAYAAFHASPASAPLSGPGIPMIHPTRAGIPAFTVADVRQFFTAHPVKSASGAPAQIAEIQFMPEEQASAIMRGEPVGLPAHALVCYVQFRGSFLTTGGYGPPQAKPAWFQLEEEVFDARTGNLMVYGFR
jgi:hypothetical protein